MVTILLLHHRLVAADFCDGELLSTIRSENTSRSEPIGQSIPVVDNGMTAPRPLRLLPVS